MTTKPPRPRRIVRASVAALIACLGLLAAGRADAQDRKTLIQTGKALRHAGDEAEALAYFQRAHQLGATPETFALMGASEYALNRFLDAELHLAEALKAPSDPFVKRNAAQLVRLFQTVKSTLGWLEIVGEPQGAEVEVAGRPAGALPLPGRIRVVAGEVNVRVSAPGYKVMREDVVVLADQVKLVNVALVAAQPAAAEKGRPPIGRYDRRDAPEPEPLSPDLVSPMASQTSSGSKYRTAGWITAGAGVVLLGAGIGAAIIRESNTKEFNESREGTVLPDKSCNEAARNAGGGPCPTLLDRLNAAKMVSYGAFAGAALAGIVSVILLSAAPDDGGVAYARPTTPKLVCAPDLLRLGGSCAVTF